MGIFALGCKNGSESTSIPELLSIEYPRQGGVWKIYAIERGYRWMAMKESVTAYVRHDWNVGDVDSSSTEWNFYAKKSPWRMAGWDEDDPEELTGEDHVAELSVIWLHDHYRWRRRTKLAYEELSCEKAEVFDRTFPTSWTPCDSARKLPSPPPQ